MERDRMRDALKGLGIKPDDYRVLKLLPLVYVAWADGKMDPLERLRIHSFAARNFELSASGAAVLEQWLTKAPSHAYIAKALRDMYSLALAQDDLEVDFSEIPALLSYAEGVAPQQTRRAGSARERDAERRSGARRTGTRAARRSRRKLGEVTR